MPLFTLAYQISALIVGGIVFIGSWFYFISHYGLLLGVGFGWVPSIIVAVVAGFLWPALLIGVAGLALLANGY